jgi:CelD/BcsL family acetyltransferase involved in cellulose biosynthesis
MDPVRDTLAALAHYSPTSKDARSDAQSDQMMAPLSLLDVPHLDGWASQWDRLVDSSPLPSPFLRSWWLAGTVRSGPHFLLIVDDATLLGGLALEEPHPTATIRMMGYGSASDHLDLLAAPGHEAEVIRLLGAWLGRPGARLLDLRGIRAGSQLIEALPGRVRREPMAVAPFTPLPVSAEAYRLTLPSQFRRNLRRSADRLGAEGVIHRTIRGHAVLSSLDTLRELHYAQWGDDSKFLPNFDRFVTACAGGSAVDEVVVHELVRGDLVVATVMAFEVAGRVSLYQSARLTDPRWRDATTALLAAIIGDACDRGFKEVDFLRGEEPYKGRFAPNHRELSRLVASTGFVGGLGRVSLVAHAHTKATAVRCIRFGRSAAARWRT